MRTASTLAWSGLVLGVIVGLACTELDPNHCANADLGCAQGLVCDACAYENDGCVRPEDAECEVADGTTGDTSVGPDTSATTTGADTTMATTSESATVGPDVPPACTAPTPGIDDACPAEMPYCVDGVCSPCTAFGDGVTCSDVDSGTPACDARGGLCHECTVDDDAACGGSTPVCRDFVCAQCLEHAECPESACNLETGACMPTDAVYYVDDGAANCPAGGDGSQGSPFCTFDEAISETNGTITLLVEGGPYEEEVTALTRTIAVLGQGMPRIVGAPNGLRLDVTAELFIFGVNIRDGLADGINCASSIVWIDDSDIRGNDAEAIDAQDCEVHVRRSRVFNHPAGGLIIDGGSVALTNTMILGNGGSLAARSGLAVDGATVEILYSTFVANDMNGATSDAIECAGAGSGFARNSILLSSGMDQSIGCTAAQLAVETSAVDDSDLAGNDGNELVLADPGDFTNLSAGNGHVDVGGPFEGIAVWMENDPTIDFDGDPRPPGAGPEDYAGADNPE